MSAIDAVVEKLIEQAQQAQAAETQRVKDALRLDEKAIKAKAYMDHVAARSLEIQKVLARTTVAHAAREKILAEYPRLAVWFDAVDAKQDALRRITVEEQSKLQRALNTYGQLTAAELLPQEPKDAMTTPFGITVSLAAWRLFEKLGNLLPTGDIDPAIERLRVAFAELNERLQAVVA